jgi:hypothetical protein
MHILQRIIYFIKKYKILNYYLQLSNEKIVSFKIFKQLFLKNKS